MEWEFTPEDVVKGNAEYGLAQFRRDLAQELRHNLGEVTAAEFERGFDAVYDLCYFLATGRTVEDLVATLSDEPEMIRLVKGVKDYMGSNVDMLGAILQRRIMDRVEAGFVLEDAIKAVAAEHRAVAVPGAIPAMA